jgi:hypothetical protein
MVKASTPKKYLLSSLDIEDNWNVVFHLALPSDISTSVRWESTTLLVYGRQVLVPKHLEGVTYWEFETLCGGTFGPADYITLASTFHTLILDAVPVLHLSRKNEARRLITLLDALYEARCKLIIRAEAGPDELFFPETQATSKSSTGTEPRQTRTMEVMQYTQKPSQKSIKTRHLLSVPTSHPTLISERPASIRTRTPILVLSQAKATR